MKAISSGFKRSGVYPFNLNALDYGASKEASNKKSKAKSSQVATSTDGQGSSASALPADPPAFTPEEEQHYQSLKTILILPDPHYLLWLKDQHHECFLELSSSNEPTLTVALSENLESDSGSNDLSTTTPAQADMSNSNVVPSTSEMSVAAAAFTLDEKKTF